MTFLYKLYGFTSPLKNNKLHIISLSFSCLMLCACDTVHKLSSLGGKPEMTQIANPKLQRGYRDVDMPMPTPEPQKYKANSLWENGARAFFKDQRAREVGDILTVEIEIDQTQSIEMKPNIAREARNESSVGEFFGLGKAVKALLGNQTGQVISTLSKPSLTGTARYDVADKMKFTMAATIIQVLPNGNLVIYGRREFRLVNEVREIFFRGIIRREDILATNIVKADKISELRVSYGGWGDLSDMQDLPLLNQLSTKISPF